MTNKGEGPNHATKSVPADSIAFSVIFACAGMTVKAVEAGRPAAFRFIRLPHGRGPVFVAAFLLRFIVSFLVLIQFIRRLNIQDLLRRQVFERHAGQDPHPQDELGEFQSLDDLRPAVPSNVIEKIKDRLRL